MPNDPARLKRLSPAKINLFLQVTSRRPDGYHNLLSLMCCIGLFDTVILLTGAKRPGVTCRHPDVPEDATNLAARAAHVFFSALSVDATVHIVIEKNIPVGAGLGGGSSNAATVLTTLNRHWGNPFTVAELKEMGLSIGSDVPFFVLGKPAVVSGIGETVAPYGGLVPYPVLVVFPGIGISTAVIYKNLNLGLTKCKNKPIYRNLNLGAFNIERDLCNDLETVAAARCPNILDAKQALMACGATGALMTGSGSSVFGLFPDPETAHRARDTLAIRENWRVFLTEILT